MTPYGFSLILLTLLSLASIALWGYVGLRLSRLTRTMVALREGLEASPVSMPAPVPAQKAGDDFAGALLASEAKKRFAGGEHREPPEKYRYVTSLIQQGLGSAEIAQVLNLSRSEVDQLVALARLAHRSTQEKETDG